MLNTLGVENLGRPKCGGVWDAQGRRRREKKEGDGRGRERKKREEGRGKMAFSLLAQTFKVTFLLWRDCDCDGSTPIMMMPLCEPGRDKIVRDEIWEREKAHQITDG